MENAIHLDLDGAWEPSELPMRTLDFRDWGMRLRYLARGSVIDEFARQLPRSLPSFLLYGSGDFHHLAAVWLRRALTTAPNAEPVTVVSFDNHPDWDCRPPRWSCGAWVNRAIELAGVRQVQVWGCGNFELQRPSRLFAPRTALREGKLRVHAWAERQPEEVQRRFDCMKRENWRDRFESFASGLAGANVYITVDLDCLDSSAAMTNWENGLFTPDDIAWAIGQLRKHAVILAGDICGAYSSAAGRGMLRRLAMWWDHPRLVEPTLHEARKVNGNALRSIWPALVNSPK